MSVASPRPMLIESDTPRLKGVLRHEVRQTRASLVVIFLATFIFLVVGRATELAPSFHFAFVVGIATIAMTILLIPRPPIFFSLPEIRAVLILWSLALLTIPFSVWPGKSFQFVFSEYSKTILLFLLVVYTIRSFRDATVLAWAFLLSASWIGLMVVVSSRTEVTAFYDRNDTALLMVCVLPLAIFRAFRPGGWSRVAAGLISLLTFYTITQSHSRGGFLALLTVGAILLWRLPLRGWPKVGILGVGILLFIWFTPQSYWDRITTIWGGDAETISRYDAGGFKQARLEIWKTGLSLMLDHPLLGVGAGAFQIAEGLSQAGSARWEAPHNSFLQIGAELGFVGLASIIYLLYRALRRCRRADYQTRHSPTVHDVYWLANGVEVALYGFIVGGSALSHAYSPFLYFLLGIAITLEKLATKYPSSETATRAEG